MEKQVEQMEKVIKSQQEMLEVLKSKIESKELVAQSSVFAIEESEIEQVILETR